MPYIYIQGKECTGHSGGAIARTVHVIIIDSLCHSYDSRMVVHSYCFMIEDDNYLIYFSCDK